MFTESLRRALTEQGVETPGASSSVSYRDRWEKPFKESEWKLLGEHLSPPVKEIIQPLQKRSQNQYAHMLWLQVGAHRMDTLGKVNPRGLSDRNVSAASESALEDLLAKMGLAPDAVLIEEGSGLSRRHLIRPRATARLLEWIQGRPYFEDFYKSLPIAAVDGTLRRRLSGTSAEGVTRAKTGTLRYAHALSGYTQSKGGEKIAFSFMLNSIQGNYGKIENVSSNPKAEIDHLVQSLSDWSVISGKQ
jgi:D-alanyl-D-alanine carboxypeptidase/D-alanyl-D-alanine-endopeptidase (penicillin-binding protein 4)